MSIPAPTDNRIMAEIFTSATRIRCAIRLRQRRLSDYLNSLDERFIMVDDAKIVPLANPQAPPRETPFVQLNREAIVFAIPHSGEVLDDQQRQLMVVHKQPHRVTLSAPPFLFHGTLHLIKEAALRDALLSVRTPFLPLTSAEVISEADGKRFSTDILIVQRARIETLCPANLQVTG